MRAVLTDKAEESIAEMQCTAYSADGGVIRLEWHKARRKSERTVLNKLPIEMSGRKIARKRGGVKIVKMKLPILLQAVSTTRYVCRTKGLT